MRSSLSSNSAFHEVLYKTSGRMSIMGSSLTLLPDVLVYGSLVRENPRKVRSQQPMRLRRISLTRAGLPRKTREKMEIGWSKNISGFQAMSRLLTICIRILLCFFLEEISNTSNEISHLLSRVCGLNFHDISHQGEF
jgi:hypothetical protein